MSPRRPRSAPAAAGAGPSSAVGPQGSLQATEGQGEHEAVGAQDAVSRQPPAAPEPRPGYVAVGRVLGAWGVRGALKIEPLTNFPERFTAGAQLWLEGEPHRVQHSHTTRGSVIVELNGVDTRELAASLRGRLLELPESELHALDEDEYYQHDLIGLHVHSSTGEELGRVTALLPTGANDVLVVQGERGEYLLPLIADIVQRVDIAGGEIVVELLEGLEPRPGGPSPRPSPNPGRGRRRRESSPPAPSPAEPETG